MFAIDYVARGQYREAHFGFVMREPLLWLGVLQAGVMASGLLAVFFGATAKMFWAVVAVKIVLELVVLRYSHKWN